MARYSSAQQAVKEITKSMTQSINPEEFSANLGNTRYHVDGTVYIFSTARRDFFVSQPLFPGLTLRGCTNGERYVLAATVPDPVPQASPDLERGGRRMDYHSGWQCAIGLLYPENGFVVNGTEEGDWTDSGDWKKGGHATGISVGTNLIAQGLFPSVKNPPEEADIRAAEQFRDRRYKWLADEAMKAGRQSSRKLNDFLHQHEDVHDAMDALGLKADWHQKREVLSKCPNCGDDIPASVAFHKSSAGIICVLDPERAFKAGAIDRARMEDLLTQPA